MLPGYLSAGVFAGTHANFHTQQIADTFCFKNKLRAYDTRSVLLQFDVTEIKKLFNLKHHK